MPPSSRFPPKPPRGARTPSRFPRLRFVVAALALVAAACSFSLPFLTSFVRRQRSLAAAGDVEVSEPKLPAALEEKVRRAHENFMRARAIVREHGLLAKEKSWRALTPEDVDVLLATGSLAPNAEQEAAAVAFAESDKAALRAFHADLLAFAAAGAARVPSPRGLSLDALRVGGPGRVRDFCLAVPKGGLLHVHPDGVRERGDPPSGLPAEGFDPYFASLREAGVTYVEFSKVFPLDDARAADVRALIERAEEKYGLVVRVNYGFLRTRSPGEALVEFEGVVRTLRDLPADGPPVLVGIDVFGNETSTDAPDTDALGFAQALFAAAQDPRLADLALRRIFHAGAFGSGRTARDAMLLGAQRLGPAVSLHLDTVALEFARRERMPVEINAVSNLRRGALDPGKTGREHLGLAYHRLGLRPSLPTGGDGVPGTGPVAECEAFVGSSDVQYAEFKAMAIRSIETSFAESSVRERLRGELEVAFDSFEAAWEHIADAR